MSRASTIPELFAAQVRRTPRAVALVFGDTAVTYAALEARSNQLARFLQERGVGPETLVGLALDRSPDLVVGLLAILKAGGAYVPIAPSHPAQRIALVLEDARTALVLTDESVRHRLPAEGIQAISLDSVADDIASQSAEPFDSPARSNHLAYVIYTSGSTGRPKGVMVEHRNVTSFFAAMDRVMGREPGVWLAVTSVAFDISVLELLWTLTCGFRVVLHPDDDPTTIPAQIDRYQVTHLQCTPSLAAMMISSGGSLASLRPLRKLLLGGEALSASLARQLRELVSGEIHNMYGPTETTIWSTSHCLAECTNNVPIGRPLDNTYVRILDGEIRQPTPLATGELVIGGDGVARGYWQRPEVTAERFIADPLADKQRLYRTGDLVRCREDGELEFLGRLDFQVKIRGFRIELGEIEAALEARPGVRQATVTAREDRPGDQRLIAYLVCEPGQQPEPSSLKADLRELLPEAMVPSAFLFLHAMPLTANGKLDRKALPAPVSPPASRLDASLAIQESPGEAMEQTIAQVWADALGVARVGMEENFFDLGAHSLLVAEVRGRLSELLQRQITVIELFRYPTVRSLALHLSSGPARMPAQQRSTARVVRRVVPGRLRRGA